MKVIVAGGTGFLGGPLGDAFARDGHEVLVLTRALPPGERRHEGGSGVPGKTHVGWRPDGGGGPWTAALEDADAVVNLAGEPIAARRWTAARKARIHDSRVRATSSLTAAIAGASRPPRLLVNASGINYYGPAGDRILTEESPPGSDFLAGVCREWEAAARQAERQGTRVALLRTGIVIERGGGALAKMLRPFRLFVGGPLGSGRQYMSWIHGADWLELVRWIITSGSVAGPVNATAPTPVTNREFSSALGRALNRPSWLPAPAFALRVALGEMADPLLLASLRVVPARAQALGFEFRFRDLDQALRDVVAP